MIRYTLLEEQSEEVSSFDEVEVDILRVWESTHMTPVKAEEIEDEFGISIVEFKKTIGNCLYNAKYDTGQWIQVDILNVM